MVFPVLSYAGARVDTHVTGSVQVLEYPDEEGVGAARAAAEWDALEVKFSRGMILATRAVKRSTHIERNLGGYI
ncbi:hypothetical protein CCR75_005650 [Bremia lactucae]|uniref:Uncharacterized protein n=1 Tax=Bremia lactucae TaxID=4779 RepID=A0A976FN48_BRELC|nr:hypothetical protein CCR75_005650 [Bremia lactucae]